MSLLVPEMCIWLAKSGKNLNVMRLIQVLDLVLEQGSDINEGNWIHFLFSSIWWWLYLYGYFEFFFQICQVLDWGFVVLHFCWKVCNWFPNLTWPQKDWFGVFCWKEPRFFVIISKWIKNCKKWSVLFFSLPEIFAICSPGNFLAISSKVPAVFSHVISYIDWWA